MKKIQIYRKNDRVYLRNDGEEKTLRFDGTVYFGCGFMVINDTDDDVTLTIDNTDGELFRAFDTLYQNIMNKYSQETTWEKEKFKRVWFIDSHTGTITFYSDLSSTNDMTGYNVETSHAFIIRKVSSKNGTYIEVTFQHNRNNKRKVNSLEIENWDAFYGSYRKYFRNLCDTLLRLADIEEERTLERDSVTRHTRKRHLKELPVNGE